MKFINQKKEQLQFEIIIIKDIPDQESLNEGTKILMDKLLKKQYSTRKKSNLSIKEKSSKTSQQQR